MINWQLKYMLTAGDHSSTLPVLEGPSLYGLHNQVSDPSHICVIPVKELQKAFAAAKKGIDATVRRDKHGTVDTPKKRRSRERHEKRG